MDLLAGATNKSKLCYMGGAQHCVYVHVPTLVDAGVCFIMSKPTVRRTVTSLNLTQYEISSLRQQ